jgi:hypothetical protein
MVAVPKPSRSAASPYTNYFARAIRHASLQPRRVNKKSVLRIIHQARQFRQARPNLKIFASWTKSVWELGEVGRLTARSSVRRFRR